MSRATGDSSKNASSRSETTLPCRAGPSISGRTAPFNASFFSKKDRAPLLLRFDARGARTEAALPPGAEPALLAVGPKGDAYIVLSGGTADWRAAPPVFVKEHQIAYYASPSDTAPRWTRALYEPIRVQGLPKNGQAVPFSATTIARIRPDGTSSAVGKFENACIRHHPGGQPEMMVAAGALFLRPWIRGVADLAGCMPAERLFGLIVRIDEKPLGPP
jgi:hypothetical protein